MNAKEARKLVNDHSCYIKELIERSDHPDGEPFDLGVAQGYLAALQGPEVKALVEALRRTTTDLDNETKHRPEWHRVGVKMGHDALTLYRQAIGEEK